MSEALEALKAKRPELVSQIKEMQSAVFHLDGAIIALGGRMPRRQGRMFGPGELMKLIGEAERAGLTSPRDIALRIMKAKRMDTEDRQLVGRLRWKVTDCRKRMNARGV